MTAVYVLIYDQDHGNREDCNIFYSPIEVFADAETREKRIAFLAKTNPEIGFRTEDLELSTVYDFEIPENLLPYEDDEDDNANNSQHARHSMHNYVPPTDPSKYCFYAHSAPDIFSDADDELLTSVSITPIDYFKQTGCMYDQHCAIDLPDGFEEVMEGEFVYDGSVEEAREVLLAHGLVEDVDFAKMIQDYIDRVNEAEDAFAKTFGQSRGSVDKNVDLDIDTPSPNPFAEYVFAIGMADDAWGDSEQVTTVYVAKREDFEKTGKLSDDSLPIRMPWGFGEVDSGHYEYDGTIAVGKYLLENLGMQQDETFTDYCRTIGLIL